MFWHQKYCHALCFSFAITSFVGSPPIRGKNAPHTGMGSGRKCPGQTSNGRSSDGTSQDNGECRILHAGFNGYCTRRTFSKVEEFSRD